MRAFIVEWFHASERSELLKSLGPWKKIVSSIVPFSNANDTKKKKKKKRKKKRRIHGCDFKWGRRKIGISPASISFETLFSKRTDYPTEQRKSKYEQSILARGTDEAFSAVSLQFQRTRSSRETVIAQGTRRTNWIRAHILLFPWFTRTRILDMSKTSVPSCCTRAQFMNRGWSLLVIAQGFEYFLL